MSESTEAVAETVEVPSKNSTRKVRSSFTMEASTMVALKERAKAEDVSVSEVIEKAVSQYVGQ